jgi:CCR4-NOT transcription complex subunit 6
MNCLRAHSLAFASQLMRMQDDVLMKEGKYAMDGCATFYRRDRFSLVKKYEVEFNKAAQSFIESIPNQAVRKRNEHRLMKPNVALILVLEGCDANSRDVNSRNAHVEGIARSLVCVANTHIHANQELSDVKLWQV